MQRQNRSLACRSRHSAWLRVGQSGHAKLPVRGAPPPQRHAWLSGRPRSFPVSPLVRHSSSSHPPRAGSGSRVRPELDRAEACVARCGLSLTGTSRGSTLPSEGPCEGGTPTATEHSGFTKPAARTRPCVLLVSECASSPNPSSACARVRVCVCVCAISLSPSSACVRVNVQFALRSRTPEQAAAIDETRRWVCLPTQPRECSLAPLQHQPGCECISLDRAPLTGA